MVEVLANLKEQFIQLFRGASDGIRVFHSPGRVNLIGEHTDYNGGYVFPAALTLGTTMLIRPRNDGQVQFASTNFTARKIIALDDLMKIPEDDWINYPKAVIDVLQKEGYSFGGYDVLYHGDLPNGAGLSSSASIEVVTGYGFLRMERQEIDRVRLAQLAQKAENQFIGVQCGIMDQFAVANGRSEHAILLDCDKLSYELVPFRSGDYRLVISNTNKRRGLVDSAYNERRSQCEQAVKDLRSAFPELQLLGELTLEQYQAHEQLIADPVVRKRARHVVEEISRVLRSVEALKSNDLSAFGQLMNESHESLRDLYEVSCRELDLLVQEARHISGVLGSRMTGAGFGGCTISIVHRDQVDHFVRQVGENYYEAASLEADFYVCQIGEGVRELKEE
jgi:galactokinase